MFSPSYDTSKTNKLFLVSFKCVQLAMISNVLFTFYFSLHRNKMPKRDLAEEVMAISTT